MPVELTTLLLLAPIHFFFIEYLYCLDQSHVCLELNDEVL